MGNSALLSDDAEEAGPPTLQTDFEDEISLSLIEVSIEFTFKLFYDLLPLHSQLSSNLSLIKLKQLKLDKLKLISTQTPQNFPCLHSNLACLNYK